MLGIGCIADRSQSLVLSEESVAVSAIMLAVLTVVHAERDQAASEDASEDKASAEQQPGQKAGVVIHSREHLLMTMRARDVHGSRSILKTVSDVDVGLGWLLR